MATDEKRVMSFSEMFNQMKAEFCGAVGVNLAAMNDTYTRHIETFSQMMAARTQENQALYQANKNLQDEVNKLKEELDRIKANQKNLET